MKPRTRPGIEAMEVYFPSQYVSQEKLEAYDGVPKGKYTIGLGQDEMCFCSDVENVQSIALTVCSNLMKKLKNVTYNDIGRLSVCTETIIDHSKSIKSVLMQLFEDSGNFDVEGCDYIHACYSGTQGLFDAINWVESGEWDGRRALIVCVDIAEYEVGPARPTGGVGAVAMLIGPDPVLELKPGRASFSKHAFDFYKPFLDSPYPVVDGKLSNSCYLNAFDSCYQKFLEVRRKRYNEQNDLESWDYCVFHSPYNKLVRKTFGRLMYNDFLKHPEKPEYSGFQELLKIDPTTTYENRTVYKTFDKASRELFEEKVRPSCYLPKRIGNCYAASLYVSLASLMVEAKSDKLTNKNILCFSYGSGLCSSIFILKTVANEQRIKEFQQITNYHHRLEERNEVSPELFTKVLAEKLKIPNRIEVQPKLDGNLYNGTYHLKTRTKEGKLLYKLFSGIRGCNL